jgi:hypothetical protein
MTHANRTINIINNINYIDSGVQVSKKYFIPTLKQEDKISYKYANILLSKIIY